MMKEINSHLKATLPDLFEGQKKSSHWLLFSGLGVKNHYSMILDTTPGPTVRLSTARQRRL